MQEKLNGVLIEIRGEQGKNEGKRSILTTRSLTKL
jgi:hypothetical protein